MNIRTLVCAAGLAATTAMAANATTFVVDGLNSSVNLTQTGGFGAGVTANLAAGLDGTTFDLAAPNAFADFDFLTFTSGCSGFFCSGARSYDISATLAFAPPAISVTSGGVGGSIVAFGQIIGGILNWNDVPVQVGFGNTGLATIDFQDGFSVFGGSSITTSASVTLDVVDVAAVPLPASGVLLLLGIGGFAAVRRSKNKAA